MISGKYKTILSDTIISIAIVQLTAACMVSAAMAEVEAGSKELLAVFQYVFNNYDRSRTRLNFQVSKDGELGPVDKTKSITDKIEQAIKNRVTGRMNATSNRAVSIVFGGNREQMRELHSRLAEVNEKYGLERGDDITITGAKHKSTETYRRELADEFRTLSNEVGMKKTLLSGLNRSITKAETKIKAL